MNSDAGVQGLPCGGIYRQGKPCTPGVISHTAGSCASLLITPRQTVSGHSPHAFSWERGHLGRYFSGRDARAPRAGERLRQTQ